MSSTNAVVSELFLCEDSLRLGFSSGGCQRFSLNSSFQEIFGFLLTFHISQHSLSVFQAAYISVYCIELYLFVILIVVYFNSDGSFSIVSFSYYFLPCCLNLLAHSSLCSSFVNARISTFHLLINKLGFINLEIFTHMF